MGKLMKVLRDFQEPWAVWAKCFPPIPPQFSTDEDATVWRVQCMLMGAEIRYSMYLKVLEKWILDHGIESSKDEWPLPPWYVLSL